MLTGPSEDLHSFKLHSLSAKANSGGLSLQIAARLWQVGAAKCESELLRLDSAGLKVTDVEFCPVIFSEKVMVKNGIRR